MRIAILSNVTIEVLAGMLKKEHAIWTPSGFGAWMETALNPPPDMREFSPDVIYIVLDRRFCNFDEGVQSRLVQAKESLQHEFPSSSIIIPDVERLAADFGDAFYDERMWKLGKMPFSMQGLRVLKKIFGLKKVLALDLDNTLWKGVIGEDGVDGILPDSRFQNEIKALKERGVLLAVLSKNNPEDVDPVWKDSRMVIEKNDIAAMAIDWNDKPSNIVHMAESLNLGVDSFVFVDDNPAERAQMRSMCPEVTVADFPPQLEVYFPPRELTDEDRQKTAQYQAESKRKDLASKLTVEDYLKSLEIWVDVHLIRSEEIQRVAQLSQKTNQFNVCTNRYSVEDIDYFVESGDHLIFTVHAGDRFGDQGLIAFVHVLLDLQKNEATILDWVMSCRTMNRRLEYAIQDKVEEAIVPYGVRILHATWRRTAKNKPVARLFDQLGFDLASDDQALSGARVPGNDAAERHYKFALDARHPRNYYVRFR